MAGWRVPAIWPKVPDRLVRFDEADWGLDDGVPYMQWRAARRAWCAEHGFDYPGAAVGSPRPPAGPLGDVIDMLNAEHALRREWLPDGSD